MRLKFGFIFLFCTFFVFGGQISENSTVESVKQKLHNFRIINLKEKSHSEISSIISWEFENPPEIHGYNIYRMQENEDFEKVAELNYDIKENSYDVYYSNMTESIEEVSLKHEKYNYSLYINDQETTVSSESIFFKDFPLTPDTEYQYKVVPVIYVEDHRIEKLVQLDSDNIQDSENICAVKTDEIKILNIEQQQEDKYTIVSWELEEKFEELRMAIPEKYLMKNLYFEVSKLVESGEFDFIGEVEDKLNNYFVDSTEMVTEKEKYQICAGFKDKIEVDLKIMQL